MEAGTLSDQEPFTAWLRRADSRDRIWLAPKAFPALGTAAAIQKQSAQRFGRPRVVLARR